MPVKVENLDEVIAAINRKYEGSLQLGNEILRLPSISTGSVELDVAMGGGVPQGRFTRYYGGFGSTKTMTAYAVIANAQKMGLLVAYYNIEKRYEPTFAEALGVDTSKLRIVQGTTIEEIAEKMESLLGVIHLHVLDSCTMAGSVDELIADVTEWRPGILARAWGKAFRRINEKFDPVDNTAILIDQMRMKKAGRNSEWIEDPAGGRVFDHQSSMSVLFRSGAWLWRAEDGGFVDAQSGKKLEDGKKNSTVDSQMAPQGREIKIRVEKSSVCRPFRTATLHYDLDTLVYDRTYEYFKAAKHYGVIRHSGSGHYQYVDADGEVTKLHGEQRVRDFIEQYPALQDYIRQVAFEAAEIPLEFP